MRLHRFYVNKPLGEEIVVENVDGGKNLIHQWTSVFRYTSGDEVILFSPLSSGQDFRYRISSASKQAVTLACVSSSPNIVPAREMTLVMSLVKKDTFETVVRQATELGVSRIIPLQASRSEKKNLNLERLRVIAIEASEQSGRGDVPEIQEILSFEDAISSTGGYMNIIGSLQGETMQILSKQERLQGKSLALWIGPEGGWTEEEEFSAKESGFLSVVFTDTVLRADTAAVALLSAVQALSSVD